MYDETRVVVVSERRQPAESSLLIWSAPVHPTQSAARDACFPRSEDHQHGIPEGKTAAARRLRGQRDRRGDHRALLDLLRRVCVDRRSPAMKACSAPDSALFFISCRPPLELSRAFPNA